MDDLSSNTPVLLVLLLVATFLLGAATTKLFSSGSNSNAQNAAVPTAQAPVAQQKPQGKVNLTTGYYPVLGNSNATVTIIEFADYQCPFCEKFFTDVQPNIINDYVNTGKAKFAFRDYPFLGDESTWAAEASACANDQGKYWVFHDYLYNHQGEERSGAFDKDKLEGFAATLGLNTDQFNSCLETDKYAKQVAADMAVGQKAGVQGTPSVFVNGQIIVGAQPYSNFKTAIDQALAGK